MPFPYTGNPTASQFPSLVPALGSAPIVNIPTRGDKLTDFLTQPFKVLADWIAFMAAQPNIQAYGVMLRIIPLTLGASIASSAGCRHARVRMVGGGGGGGGCNTLASGAGGGAAGGYAEFFTTVIPANWTYAVGVGGAGGGSSPTDGFAGGATTFSDGVTTVTAFGGGGGGRGYNNVDPGIVGPAGLAPAISTNGTINGSGEAGGDSRANTISGYGGSSLLGGSGGKPVGIGSIPSAGNSGVGPGAGGSGGFSAGALNVAGGSGTAGMIILEEWS